MAGDAEAVAVLGNNVRRIRRRMGLSQEKLARRIPMERADLTRLERGVGNPSIARVQQIAAALEVQPATLLRAS